MIVVDPRRAGGGVVVGMATDVFKAGASCGAAAVPTTVVAQPGSSSAAAASTQSVLAYLAMRLNEARECLMTGIGRDQPGLSPAGYLPRGAR